jgi:putative Mn2+ efflux pump MntP
LPPAVGTSIDAAAVGVGLAILGMNIWMMAALIGAKTQSRVTSAKRAEFLGRISLGDLGVII